MARALTDRKGIETPTNRLPDSVDRLLGIPSEDPEPQLTKHAIDALLARLAAEAPDSNIDRMPINREFDALFDGTAATRVMAEALRLRMEHPVLHGEIIRIAEPR